MGGVLLWKRTPFRRFYRAAREPVLVAFATTSSAAAVPQVLANMEQYGISKRALGVVAPISLSFNLAGSAIHLEMCFFAAQAAVKGWRAFRERLL